MSDEFDPEKNNPDDSQKNDDSIDELTDQELDDVAGGDKPVTPTPRPSISEIVVTKRTDVSSSNLF